MNSVTHNQIMEEISAANSKLHFLEKARDIENAEEKKKESQSNVVEQSTDPQLNADKMEQERYRTRYLLSNMNKDAGIKEISAVLNNFEGKLHHTPWYLSY